MEKSYKNPGYGSIVISSILLVIYLIFIILSILYYNNNLTFIHYMRCFFFILMFSSGLFFLNILVYTVSRKKTTEKEEEAASKKLINTNTGLFISSIVLYIIMIIIVLIIAYYNLKYVDKPIFINENKTEYICNNSKGLVNLNCKINRINKPDSDDTMYDKITIKDIINRINYNHKPTSGKEFPDKVIITAPGEEDPENNIVMEKVIKSINNKIKDDELSAKNNIHMQALIENIRRRNGNGFYSNIGIHKKDL